MTEETDADSGAMCPNAENSGTAGVESGQTSGRCPETPFASPGQAAETYILCRFIFVRGVALIFLLAFFSLSLQLDGLFGKSGILPISALMQSVPVNIADPGQCRYFAIPTVFWLSDSDSFLYLICFLAMAFSGLAFAGIFCGPSLLICWFFYLSFVTAGAEFMSFQWDILLLEAGILAALWAPWAMASPPLSTLSGADGPPSLTVLWLLRWLLFRLMFMSGLCKLMSGDDSWWSLTALSYHYETQPLPTPLAWFFNCLPMFLQQLSCLIMFAIEILCPFLIWGDRRMRRVAFAALVSLQVLILLTGNYTFFNLLSILLCFTLIDDSIWQRLFPQHLKSALLVAAQINRGKWQRLKRILVLPFVAIIVFTNIGMLAVYSLGGACFPQSVRMILACVQPLHLVNSYGLFAVMTVKRIEIILEGSNDGKEWLPYEFSFKPGDLRRSPPVVAPLQPRLDWQMWFAALGTYEDNPWFASFVRRILKGDKKVVALLAANPFPSAPPKYVRARIYQYHFSGAGELFSTGNWWTRTYVGEYMPPESLKEAI